MLLLAFRNLGRRPLRSFLAVSGLAMAIAVLTCLWAFGHGYERALGKELDRMGMQMMLVPLGCPYDAAARVLKGKTLENSLPDSVLEEARHVEGLAAQHPVAGRQVHSGPSALPSLLSADGRLQGEHVRLVADDLAAADRRDHPVLADRAQRGGSAQRRDRR